MARTQIKTPGIAVDAVTAAQIAAGAVGTSEIANDAVTAAKIAAGAVGTTEIADGSIGLTKITNEIATKTYVDASKYTIISGVSYTNGFTNQVGSFNDGSNFFDLFPPAGKTMSNLVAFIPSIHVIHFSGDVNQDDSFRCSYAVFGDRIRVWVQNTEQRSAPAANYLMIWS